ncbi:FAD-binding protein, partial [Acidobacteriota bacterium]
GLAIPYWEGVPLKDMEFVQFHPTTLFGTNILMTEGCRGEGGYLTNNQGERFLGNYSDSRKAMEIAPRDIVARNIQREVDEGRGYEKAYVHLELQHLGEKKIMIRLPGIRTLAMDFAGVDPITEPVPVQPGQHYTMGGIDCNKDCETPIEGLYAAGECACVSVHGANRLGGNSLLETIVFGQIAGESAAKFFLGKGAATKSADTQLHESILKRETEKVESIKSSTGKENPFQIKQELQTVMKDKVGIFREEESLQEAVDKIRELKERFQNTSLQYKEGGFNYNLLGYMDIKGSLDVAETIAVGALTRKESRGSHFRMDFSKRDDENWLKHTVATLVKGECKLSYTDVNLELYPPVERKY